jgi:hypothetical protein
MWAAIIAKLEELAALGGARRRGGRPDADDPYDPTEFIDEDDEF